MYLANILTLAIALILICNQTSGGVQTRSQTKAQKIGTQTGVQTRSQTKAQKLGTQTGVRTIAKKIGTQTGRQVRAQNKAQKIGTQTSFKSDSINIHYVPSLGPREESKSGKAKWKTSKVPKKITATISLNVDPRSGSGTSKETLKGFQVESVKNILNNQGKVSKPSTEGKRTAFVAFHLLNDKLGGLAKNNNLVLGTNSFNQQYLRKVETPMKYFTYPDTLNTEINAVQTRLEKAKIKQGQKYTDRNSSNQIKLARLQKLKTDIEKFRKDPENKIKLEIDVHYIKSDKLTKVANEEGYKGDPAPHSVTIKVTPMGVEAFKAKFQEQYDNSAFKKVGDSRVTNIANWKAAKIGKKFFNIPPYDKSHRKTRFDMNEQESRKNNKSKK